MGNPQLHPLEVNSRTGEPFLRLKNHENIILTPPRVTDAQYLPVIFNDPRVHPWLSSPPYPYLQEHGEAWVTKIKASTDAVLAELDATKDTHPLKIVEHCPVRSIREVKEDGTDVFLGDVDVLRCKNGELMGPNGLDWTQKARYEKENNTLRLGDPNITWSIGDYLAPSHHRRGIMSDVVATILQEWAIPRMGVHRVLVTAFTGNEGSVKVFTKNGFVLTRTLEEYAAVKGRMRGLHVLEWSKP